MQAIQPIQMEQAGSGTRRLMEGMKSEQGAVPNMLRTMANSPQVVEGYLQFVHALQAGKLAPQLRERIALAVAQANHSEYALSQHAWQAARAGLTQQEIQQSREGDVADAKLKAALRFAQALASRHPETPVTDLRDAGYTDGEILEIVALVAVNEFEALFDRVAKTEIDFPKVGWKTRAA